MKKMTAYLATLAATAWVGGLWGIGYLAVPILFHAQADRALAGMLAGQMFVALGYLGMICGGYLLIQGVSITGRSISRQFWVIAAMLLITLVLQFAVHPLIADLKIEALPLDILQSPLAASFKLWHGISSVLYLLQSLLGACLVLMRANLRSLG